METTQVLLLLLSVTVCSALRRQDLGGEWIIDNGPDAPVRLATVPGGIFSDLMAGHAIEDIFYGEGDTNYNWVGQTDWTYRSEFTVDEELLAFRVVSIVFEGLDTFATISINGVEIGTTENMFRRYVFDIQEHLQVGSNNISVTFTSAANKAKALATDPNNPYPIPPTCPPSEYNGICYVNRIRKMQSSFSWDWGPAFASSGIWKEVYLLAYDDAYISYFVAEPKKTDEGWDVVVTTYISNAQSGISLSILNTIALEDKTVGAHHTNIKTGRSIEIAWSTTLKVNDSDINLWWPNGYGSQPLYNVTTTLITSNDQQEKTVRIGFRTVELVQEELGQGLSFYFKVNDVPIFAKGANEIPLNILPEKGQDPATVRNVLQSARDAHMNMLRVWGGGVYESDYFYDVADEYGIMIWQDFMFACALYPTDEDFLNNVDAEVRHQVKRLGNHPSIAVWAGNNENEAALAQNWWGTFGNLDTYKKDYNKLYVDTIKPVVEYILPQANYLTSSPTNGKESDEEDHVAKNPGDVLYGDVHVYDYFSDSWSVRTFPTPRFASEYGYQSMPSLDSWLTATNNVTDVNPSSAFLKLRQHHPGGNEENLNLIGKQLQLPDASSENYGKAFIYYSQILQAQSIKTETEHYRSFKGRVNANGQGNTMGALYWQLNDVWVAPTWSGIEFTGRWKILHYQAQQFYSPIIITGTLTTDNSLELYAVADGLELPSGDVRAVIHVYNWSGLEVLLTEDIPVTLDLSSAVLVALLDASAILTAAGCGGTFEDARNNCFFHLHLMDQDDNNLAPFNYVFLQKLKDSNLANASVEISSVTGAEAVGTTFEIVVTTDAPALFVWLDSHEIRGRFSENGFLQVQASKPVAFTADDAVSVEDLTAALTVTHLRDSAYL